MKKFKPQKRHRALAPAVLKISDENSILKQVLEVLKAAGPFIEPVLFLVNHWPF